MLTETFLRKVKPTDTHQFIADGHGLYLRVHPSGKKQFLYRSRAGGKASWTVLGEYPALSLLEARNLALNPVNINTDGGKTVDDVFEIFYKFITTQYKKPEAVRAKYELDLKPVIGSKRITEVTRAEVADILQKVVDRNSPVMANRLLADVKHLFDFAVDRGWLDENVLKPLTRRHTGGKEQTRQRTLNYIEMQHHINLLQHGNIHLKTRLALALITLTGQRSSEVTGLSKSEITGVWWTIPKERTKANREQKVYLSIQARAVLKYAFKFFGDAPFGFDHRTMSKALLRRGVGYTPHDLRRTLATSLSELGVLPHVIEKILNHQMEGVMAVYNRAEYLEERKKAWALWGRHLAALRRTNYVSQ